MIRKTLIPFRNGCCPKVPTVGIAALLILGFLTVPSRAEVLFVERGQPKAEIIVPASPSAAVENAANELRSYLVKISGAGLPIVEEHTFKGGLRVDVGLTHRAEGLLQDKHMNSPEGFLICCDKDGLVLCGGSDLGTHYAVYRFLEDFLGCRWLAPGEEFVPLSDTVAVPEVARTYDPDFDLRLYRGTSTGASMDWGIKVGLNGFYTREFCSTHGGGYFKPTGLPHTHTWYSVIPAAKYFDKHPEWFPLLDGKRVPGKVSGGQLCVTAEGLADEFAKNVIKVLDADPDSKILSISPNDGYGWCECEKCRELDRKLCGARTTKQGLGRERPFRGDRVFWFSNQVAQRIAKKYPGKMLLVLAYVNYAEPPDTIRPLPNVVPWLCHYAPADYSRPINDPSSQANSQFNALLKGWSHIAPHLLFYSYVSKSMWWRLPRPVTRSFSEDLKYLKSLGIHRYYCQSSLSDWPLDGPLYYVLAHLMWDASSDPDTLIEDWVRHMFGTASGPMRKFYNHVELAVRNTGKSYSDNPPRDVPGLYDRKELESASGELRIALVSTTESIHLERVRKVARVFDYGYWMIRAIEAGERFKKSQDPMDFEDSIRCGTRALALIEVSQAGRYLESISRARVMGVLTNGFGKAETRGGKICWNTDETGPGDGEGGWATFVIRVKDTSQPAELILEVWGESDLESIVVDTGGQGKSTDQGGRWTAIKPVHPLKPGKKWQKLSFRIPPEAWSNNSEGQRIGLGGGDSQIWISSIEVVSPD